MNDHARAVIDAAAKDLAGRVHTEAELGAALFALVRECNRPYDERRPTVVRTRRTPVAGEILPPHQRATWARGTTIYDVIDIDVTPLKKSPRKKSPRKIVR